MALGFPTFPFVDALPCPFRREQAERAEPVLPPGHLRWSRTVVQGRPAVYGEAGEGPPVVFLHGWGLGHHAYKRPLARLALRGMRVLAPALPGFGGTADLPSGAGIHAHGVWLDAFMEAVGVDEPAVVIGHSFGGGVAITLAHDYRSRVAKLVLVNSVGGAAWGNGELALSDRPLFHWAFTVGRWPRPEIGGELRGIVEPGFFGRGSRLRVGPMRNGRHHAGPSGGAAAPSSRF